MSKDTVIRIVLCGGLVANLGIVAMFAIVLIPLAYSGRS